MELVLAPIHGITYANYRNSFHKIFGGIDTYFTPFISPTDLRIRDSIIFDDVKPMNNSKLNIVPQLLGNNPTDFTFFGNRIAKYGYKEINWNLGCPQRNITKKMKGSGLLSEPELVESILEEVCRDKNYELSVKIRLGQFSLDEGIKIIDVLNKFPLKGVIIHPRTAKQMYGGQVDLEGFETLYKECKHEVTYNGDIVSLEDITHLQETYPDIDKFMIGRGILSNPFLPAIIRGKSYSQAEKQQMVLDFHDLIYEDYLVTVPTEIRVLGKMKEFWPYLAWFFDSTGELKKSVRLSSTYEEYLKVINALR